MNPLLNLTSIIEKLVPRARVELARPYGHYVLNVARLPFRHPGTRIQTFSLRSLNGGRCRIRTYDPLLVRQVL